jgi:hypothetical protein
MKVNIISIHNRGNYEKEHVLMRVLDDCDIGRYMLADSTYTPKGQVSNKVRHTFWIPDKEVKKGDLVSVWTRSGNDTTTKNDNGDIIHRFYWDLKSSVWNDDGDCAVLFEMNTWQFFPVK